MAHHQQGDNSRTSAVKAMLKMLRLSTTSTLPKIEDDDVLGEADEPPDDQNLFKRVLAPRFNESFDLKAPKSLLTRALMSSPEQSPEPSPELSDFPGFASMTPATISTRSSGSVPSTAELTSDGGITSPDRSNPPSPPPASSHLPLSAIGRPPRSHITIAGDIKPPTVSSPSVNHEANVEANLGRKRCISFACGRKAAEEKVAEQKQPEQPPAPVEPPKRKCSLTFACPPRTGLDSRLKDPSRPFARRPVSPAPLALRRSSTDSHLSLRKPLPVSGDATSQDLDRSEKTRFHEFEISHKEEDEWVNEITEAKPRITINDCMKKEMAIRRIGEQAEQEADEEEDEDEEDEDDDDDSGFSDQSSDDGNESDNEEGFADSDDESVYGSDDHFWAPSTTTATTSTDQLEHIRALPQRNASETSLESIQRREAGHIPIFQGPSITSRKRPTRLPKFRPGTPDLPDSTDFVCGTLDEDRPLEAAYISCMEERRRAKHVPIPQDIDPSFPTSDPEANDDDDDSEEDDIPWMEGIDDKVTNGRRKSTDRNVKLAPHSPKRPHALPSGKGITLRSPPPRHRATSSPKRPRSPAPNRRATFGISPPRRSQGLRITGRLNQGCDLVRTNSLPRTPNPFFARQHKLKDISDGEDLDIGSFRTEILDRRLSHTRGPIDIVEGLEKKRQKRAEKFWRQHCRKAAKEEQQRKPIPGKGYERMKEIGLEVAERTKGYGPNQPEQLVLSI